MDYTRTVYPIMRTAKLAGWIQRGHHNDRCPTCGHKFMGNIYALTAKGYKIIGVEPATPEPPSEGGKG